MKSKLVLFIGNGFTINLAKFLNIDKVHDTTQLIPPLEWLQDFSKNLNNAPLWSRERYPDLWDTWHSLSSNNSNVSFNDLCKHLSDKQCFTIGPDPINGPAIIFEASNPGYQLRLYLWHYFFYYLEIFINRIFENTQKNSYQDLLDEIKTQTSNWPIINLILALKEKYDLWIISYNYDGYLLGTLLAHGKQVYNLTDRFYEFIDGAPHDSVKIIHPHGSMCIRRPLINNEHVPFGDEIINASKDVAMVFFHDSREFSGPKFRFPYYYVCPSFPDLIPPGHNETHLLAKWSDYGKSIQKLIQTSQVVGSIGFSATNPDDKEFTNFFKSKIPKTFSVGIKDLYQKNPEPSAIILNEFGDNYSFFDISEISNCQNWLLTT